MTFQDLPTLNAVLNSISIVLLSFGFANIRRKNIQTHRKFMIGAACTSTLFLISYLIYHSQAGTTHFQGQGLVRTLYFAILLSHTVLAVVIAPLVLITLWRAYRNDFARHKKIARWTWPLWMYVSITGVLVYLMLYHYPGAS